MLKGYRAAALILALGPATLTAQTSACLAGDSVTTFVHDHLIGLVSSTDTAVIRERIAMGLPSLRAADVSMVSDSTVCAIAAGRLAAITPNDDAHPAAWVIRLGATRYVAFNLRQKVHGSAYLFVFDNEWTRIGSFPI